jgi:nucleotide-binding universal stress UspA family protein
MFKHILVPLDGSILAEAALPVAAFLARALDASVTLIHVIERNAPKEVHSEKHLSTPEEAEIYLAEASKKAFPEGIRIDHHVHTAPVNDVARSIVEHSVEMVPDLVVMCTHGRGGLRDFLYGSIAQQVIAYGKTPVLLVRPDSNGSGTAFKVKKLLVPLDGIPDHEQGLRTAIALAQACEASLHLLMVVPTNSVLTGEHAVTRRLMPGATSAMLDMAEEGGEEYLRSHLVALQQAKLQVTAEVARGEPALTIVDVSRRVEADLIILGTHGKAGMDAFWEGSVTPRISSQSTVPLMLVPVHPSP